MKGVKVWFQTRCVQNITEGKEKSDPHKDFMFTLCIYSVFYSGPDL